MPRDAATMISSFPNKTKKEDAIAGPGGLKPPHKSLYDKRERFDNIRERVYESMYEKKLLFATSLRQREGVL